MGESSWKKIAAKVGNRSHVQALQRWKQVLAPGIIKGTWSKKEDDLLQELMKEDFKNWGELARFFPGRTAKQCRERWSHHLDPTIDKSPFTVEEDEIALVLYSELGPQWSNIAKHIRNI